MTTLVVRNARSLTEGAPVDVVAEGGTIKEIRPASGDGPSSAIG